jgi:hypothetical protein
MKLMDVSLLSIALALIVVGVHQTMLQGIGFSYSFFMFAVGLLFWFQLRKTKGQAKPKEGLDHSKKPIKPKRK